MKFYFVGLDLRDDAHDYAPLEAALRALHGRKVSPRIWMCVVNRSRTDALTAVYRQLATGDQIMVIEVPPTMRLPEAVQLAA